MRHDQCYVCGDRLSSERLKLSICFECGKVTQCEPVPPFLLALPFTAFKAPFKYHASHIMERMRAEMKARAEQMT